MDDLSSNTDHVPARKSENGSVALGDTENHEISRVQEGITEETSSSTTKPSSLARADTVELVNDRDKSTANNTNDHSSLERIQSVFQDATAIVKLLNVDNFDAIYNRVKELRSNLNRSDIVTNEIIQGEDNLHNDAETLKVSLSEMYPNSNFDIDRLRNLLEQHKYAEDRIIVVQRIISKELESQSNLSTTGISIQDEDIARFLQNEDKLVLDLEAIIAKYPTVDPHEAFKLLITKFVNSSDRVTDVVEYLTSSSQTGSEVSRDALMRDTDTISTLFPNRSRNEIYAYLEAHYHTHNRVQVVMEELLNMDQTNTATDVSTTPKRDLPRQPSKRPSTSHASKSLKHGGKRTKYRKNSGKIVKQLSQPFPELRREKEVDLLHAVFPDCDPDYLFSKLEMAVDDPERVQRLSEEMFENADYPKLRDRLRRERRARRLAQLENQELDMKDFLMTFPNPTEVFENDDKKVGNNFKKHSLTQLLNDYPLVSEAFIKEKLEQNNGHYYLTKACIDDLFDEVSIATSGEAEKQKETISAQILQEPRQRVDFPDDLDEFFFKELLYVKHREEIAEHLRKLEEEKQTCEDCDICCETVRDTDMISCEDEHKYCRACVFKYMKEYMMQRSVTFPCMNEDCDQVYPLELVKNVLPSSQFSLLLGRIQEDEIRRAGIKDLVSCPFCSFATIMSDPNDRVFKCLNPECFRESCRLCQEPNHVPLRCDEIRRQGESDMKTYIEKRMTEAMLRVCWRCKKRYFKTEGCNRMMCPCGASMCYLCRSPVRNYDHFNNSSNVAETGCQLYGEALDLHWIEMKKAAAEAKQEWIKLHPEDEEKAKSYNPLDVATHKTGKKDATDDNNETGENSTTPNINAETANIKETTADTGTECSVQTTAGTKMDRAESVADSKLATSMEKSPSANQMSTDVPAPTKTSSSSGTSGLECDAATTTEGGDATNVTANMVEEGTSTEPGSTATDTVVPTPTKTATSFATSDLDSEAVTGTEGGETTDLTANTVEEGMSTEPGTAMADMMVPTPTKAATSFATSDLESDTVPATEGGETTDLTANTMEEGMSTEPGTAVANEVNEELMEQDDVNPLAEYYEELEEEDLEELREVDIPDEEFEQAMEEYRRMYPQAKEHEADDDP